MLSKYKVLIIGAGLFVVIGIGLLAYNRIATNNLGSQKSAQSSLPIPYSPVVPPNTIAPKAGDNISNRDIAVPISVASSAEDKSVVIRTFAIKVANNVYDPNIMVANIGDTVKINLTAVDKPYDLTIPELNLAVSAQKKETKTLEFKALKEGKYLYYCALCGGINSSTRGYIILTQK